MMMTTRTLLLVLSTLLLVGACASSSGSRGPRADPDELTREEIMSVEARTLYDVVRRLRPRWLTAARRAGDRSFGLTTEVVVFQEQTLLGNTQVLNRWSPSAVAWMEWMDASTASASLPGLGSRHVAGAIIIHTSER